MVGVSGRACCVQVEESDTVADSETVIKEKKENDLKAVGADRLRLYLSKRGSKWMAERGVGDLVEAADLRDPDLQYATPVEFPPPMVLSVGRLNFSPAKAREYVSKLFDGIACVQDGTTREGSSAMETFCVDLAWLTSRHVGLCATAVSALNEVYLSRVRSACVHPSAGEWIVSPRAVAVLSTLESQELNELEHLGGFDADIVERCVRRGILVQNGHHIEFSSPVIRRFFVKMNVGHIVRALDVPETLPDLIARILQAVDYDGIRQTLVRVSRLTKQFCDVGRRWRVVWIKWVHRFTIRDDGDTCWGIKLLRAAGNLNEYIERFATGGCCSWLGLSDFCLVEFRCVASVHDNAMKDKIAAGMHEKLFASCYDAGLANVAVSNAQVGVVFSA
ncbi:hypothetical protein FI667_g5461, partial [Globisporangium splendens]